MRTIMLKGDGAVVGHVTVRVIENGHGESFVVARSRAQRLLAQCGQCESVTLDFDGVDQIGQGFADEIFRVFANQHPGTRLARVNCNADVERMVRHVMP